jgi:hypothetical protein
MKFSNTNTRQRRQDWILSTHPTSNVQHNVQITNY